MLISAAIKEFLNIMRYENVILWPEHLYACFKPHQALLCHLLSTFNGIMLTFFLILLS